MNDEAEEVRDAIAFTYALRWAAERFFEREFRHQWSAEDYGFTIRGDSGEVFRVTITEEPKQ
jgi:hypothetical protein